MYLFQDAFVKIYYYNKAGTYWMRIGKIAMAAEIEKLRVIWKFRKSICICDDLYVPELDLRIISIYTLYS